MSKDEIYELYKDKVMGYMYSRVNDKYLAEDLCANVFVKVYEKIDSFDDKKASISTWIFTIAHNTLIDYYRVRKVYVEVTEDLINESDLEEEVCNNEMLESVAKALKRLDERGRDLIIMRYYLGLSLKDIAEKMNISYSYTKIIHNKALGELKNILEGVS